MLGVTDQRWQADARIQQPVAAFPEHRFIDVGVNHLTANADFTGKGQGEIPGAAGNVEHALALFHIGDQHGIGLPGAMHSQRHQVVHQIVFGRYRIEDDPNPTRLFLLINRFKTEVGTCHSLNARAQSLSWWSQRSGNLGR